MRAPLLLSNARVHLSGKRPANAPLPPIYGNGFLRGGDIIVEMIGGTAGHTILVAPNAQGYIHSVFPAGVSAAQPPGGDLRVYRYAGPDDPNDPAADRAAYLALEWKGKVGYGSGSPWRALMAGLGSSGFGRGAAGRLSKYHGREVSTGPYAGMRSSQPTNAICSELCVLVFQLTSREQDASFIQLDAKHCTPERLRRYFDERPDHWRRLYPA